MKALVYHGPGKRSWEEKPKPKIKDSKDVIIRITKTTICGTDLHIMKGDVPEVVEGLTLGHEGIGVIEEVGASVSILKLAIMF
ncbi:MAG: alcohol dehydrogenase catalytic domain-containing protein [Ignavibacteriales bacterium]|nr:alcohol dehydrogenase catalytic domain-containing protein [Ignavibacteriales bacterium]